ncbi:unnamed protein product [Echinostoma caproni]|uniref:Exocyst complex component Sec10 n=1 Tax=Echinostoma caproni TaxID=27848 RepID=A0A183AIR1_9TREM|nr:unnamed protein product [Echinostoma caproni]
MQVFFRRQIAEILTNGRQAISGLIKPSKSSSHMSRVLESAAETASVISVHNPEGAVLVQVGSVGIRPNRELESLPGCMHTLFSSIENDALAFISDCEQIQPLLVMPLLVAFSRALDMELQQSGMESAEKLSREQAPFMVFLLSHLTMVAKRAFNRYVERLINVFAEGRPSKRSRCGILRIVHTYVEFAECSLVVFSQSQRLADLERAHGELMPPLDDYLQEVKRRYNRALQEYTKNSMGRPLEKLATFFEGVQTALDAGVRPEVIQYQFAFSKQELKKVIREYPGKEVVWRSIQNEFLDQCGRFNVLIDQCYPDSSITLEFTRTDLENYFREIAPPR